MLRKLLKYELQATVRKFLPIYGGMLAASVLVNLALRFSIGGLFTGMVSLTLGALSVALIVLTLNTVIQRFKDHLFSDEGYLMLTLPVPAWKIILSKLLAALVWAAAGLLVAALSFLLVVIGPEFTEAVQTFFGQLRNLLGYIETEHIVFALLTLLAVVTQYCCFVLTVYTALSIGQTALFHRRKGVASFGAFLVISIGSSTLLQGIFSSIFPNPNFYNLGQFNTLMLVAALSNIALSVVAFFATGYLIKHHLNLD